MHGLTLGPWQNKHLGSDFKESVTTLLEAASMALILALQHNKRHRYLLSASNYDPIVNTCGAIAKNIRRIRISFC